MSDTPKRLSVEELLASAVPLTHTPNLNRLTCQLSLVHQCRGDQPKGVQRSSTLQLETKEEVWSRRLEITNTPIHLPTGWTNSAENVGFLCVENLAGEGLEVNPTAEEAERIKNSLIILYYNNPQHGIVVHPGFPQPVFPTDLSSMMIMGLEPSVLCRITIFPR